MSKQWHPPSTERYLSNMRKLWGGTIEVKTTEGNGMTENKQLQFSQQVFDTLTPSDYQDFINHPEQARSIAEQIAYRK